MSYFCCAAPFSDDDSSKLYMNEVYTSLGFLFLLVYVRRNYDWNMIICCACIRLQTYWNNCQVRYGNAERFICIESFCSRSITFCSRVLVFASSLLRFLTRFLSSVISFDCLNIVQFGHIYGFLHLLNLS